jgi:hypothetical protein
MREAAGWVRKHGGAVDKAIEDRDADHGGFHRNPANMNATLEIFCARLVATPL